MTVQFLYPFSSRKEFFQKMENFLCKGFLDDELSMTPLRYEGGATTNRLPAPEMYHLLGYPDEKIMSCLKHAHRLRVPVIYSPFDVTALVFDNMERYVSALHLNSKMEQKTIAKKKYKGKCIFIPNSLTTTQITTQAMMLQLRQLYFEVLELNRENLRKEIAAKVPQTDEALREICQQVLYAQLLIDRQRLTHQFLTDFSSYLVQTSYDEDKLQQLLQTLKISNLMARLLQLMSETTQLSEGFMPISPLDDKTTKQIRLNLEK